MTWQHVLDLLHGEMASGLVATSMIRLVLAAVSYTHLDVYKRQLISSGGVVEQTCPSQLREPPVRSNNRRDR